MAFPVEASIVTARPPVIAPFAVRSIEPPEPPEPASATPQAEPVYERTCPEVTPDVFTSVRPFRVVAPPEAPTFATTYAVVAI